jgi:thymidylate synthase
MGTSYYYPLGSRSPDTQYRDRLRQILVRGEIAKTTPQGVGAITCFGTLSPMVFNLRNGVPLITERALGSWKSAVAEIIAFVKGARTVDEIEAFGVNKAFWGSYRGKGTELGLADPNDMGPGSYGAVFHDWECADGTTLNQFAQILDQIQQYPHVRSHRVTNWRPEYTARGQARKVIVAPCHGELHFRVLNDKLHMRMDQRSGDFPIGVPHNMIQYAALHLMMCQVTNYLPGNFVHSFADAHIYENQLEAVEAMLREERSPRPFPVLYLDPAVRSLFDFRIEHFRLEEYDPHPKMDVPFAP